MDRSFELLLEKEEKHLALRRFEIDSIQLCVSIER